MKNYEKYADEIREYKGDSICADFVEPYILKSINAKCTNISCVKCHLYRTIWLMEEYEEPEIDWSKVEVDTPILVRDSENTEWLKKHFAKYEDGIVYVWNLGRTSWSAPNNKSVSAWQYAKLIEDGTESGVDWSEVEVDTPILVKHDECDKWSYRYFAKYENGVVYAWHCGCTGWAKDCTVGWEYAKLAEGEESK